MRCPFCMPVCMLGVSLLLACGVAARTSKAENLTDGIDASVRPGDDFFAYANNAWLKAHPIPPDRSSCGTLVQLQELTEKRIGQLIKDVSETATPGSEEQKIGALYSSFMDEATIEAKGIQPLRPDLEPIANIVDRRSLAHVLGKTLRAAYLDKGSAINNIAAIGSRRSRSMRTQGRSAAFAVDTNFQGTCIVLGIGDYPTVRRF
jgi:hypothetical protein